MNCDKCGKPSVYRSTLIVNGVSQTTNLCRDCAVKEGVFATESSLFEDMFSPFFGYMPFEKVEDVKCPVCKLTLKQFKRAGKLGCPNCYDAFREEISKLINKIAPNKTHKQEINKTAKKQTSTNKLSELKQLMAEAVKEERYEDAAKIKKQIQKLEAKDE